jgi:hypothetical protein
MIIGVAVKQGCVFICLPKPNRHHDCINYAVEVLGLKPPIGAYFDGQGFYTEEGHFLNRIQAYKHALENNQITNRQKTGNGYNGDSLFSEDLW